MATSPMQSPTPEEATLKGRRGDLEALSTVSLSASPGWGERLLPYLFAAMETCWVDAIFIGLASVGFSQSHELFMPLWVPFVLLSGTCWLATYLERRGLVTGVSVQGGAVTFSSGSVLLFVLLAMVTLFAIWSGVYASSIALYDPSWLGALLSDILSFSPNAFHTIGIIALAIYFCFRGLRLARTTLEPGNVFNVLRLGMGIIIAVVLFRAANGVAFFDELFLLLLMPFFLAFALTAHAFAQAIFVRRFHTVGLQGSIVAQEHSLLMVIGVIAVALLLVSLSIGSLASPTFLAQAQHVLEPIAIAYDWIARAFAYAVGLLVTPIFWLLQSFHFKVQPPKITPLQSICIKKPNLPACIKRSVSTAPDGTAGAIGLLFIKILLPILVIVLAILLVRLALKRRRVRLMTQREDEQHESLWSWELFLTQLRAFLRALWFRFFPPGAVGEQQQGVEEDMPGEPTARSIREIYRAMLRWAAGRGYPRKKDETPYEFRSRLNERMPLAEPELGTVTEAYTAIRYGRVVPSEAEVARVQQVWMQLQQKSQVQ